MRPIDSDKLFPVIIQALADTKPLDVVEVVRCKDCKHFQFDKLFGRHYCDGREVSLEHFCGYAERWEE